MKKEQKVCPFKSGDTVKIITGSKKGLIGKIKTILFKKSLVFLDGILPRVKFTKKTQNAEGKRIELEIPIHLSNVMLWDNESKVASRIGFKFIENKKVRYFNKSGNLV